MGLTVSVEDEEDDDGGLGSGMQFCSCSCKKEGRAMQNIYTQLRQSNMERGRGTSISTYKEDSMTPRPSGTTPTPAGIHVGGIPIHPKNGNQSPILAIAINDDPNIASFDITANGSRQSNPYKPESSKPTAILSTTPDTDLNQLADFVRSRMSLTEQEVQSCLPVTPMSVTGNANTVTSFPYTTSPPQIARIQSPQSDDGGVLVRPQFNPTSASMSPIRRTAQPQHHFPTGGGGGRFSLTRTYSAHNHASYAMQQQQQRQPQRQPQQRQQPMGNRQATSCRTHEHNTMFRERAYSKSMRDVTNVAPFSPDCMSPPPMGHFQTRSLGRTQSSRSIDQTIPNRRRSGAKSGRRVSGRKGSNLDVNQPIMTRHQRAHSNLICNKTKSEWEDVDLDEFETEMTKQIHYLMTIQTQDILTSANAADAAAEVISVEAGDADEADEQRSIAEEETTPTTPTHSSKNVSITTSTTEESKSVFSDSG